MEFPFHNTKKIQQQAELPFISLKPLSPEKWGRKQLLKTWTWRTLDMLPDILSLQNQMALSTLPRQTLKNPSTSPFYTLDSALHTIGTPELYHKQ